MGNAEEHGRRPGETPIPGFTSYHRMRLTGPDSSSTLGPITDQASGKEITPAVERVNKVI
jgi:hypothetical protein